MPAASIRPAKPADLAALNDIYNHYVAETASTFDTEPTPLEQRFVWFDQFGTTGRHRLWVAEEAGNVVGYACSHTFRIRPAYSTSVETTIYLAPTATGRGLGAALYGALFDSLRDQDVHRAYAGITIPNPVSVSLHRRHGFEPIGVFREVGRKLGRYWSVEWFEKPLLGSPAA